MTADKISTILEQYYGISKPLALDRWIKLPQISIIHLDQEANLFLDENQIFYFDSDDESLNISQSLKYKNLKTLEKSFKSYPTHIKIDMNKICGFISTTTLGPSGVYLNRPF